MPPIPNPIQWLPITTSKGVEAADVDVVPMTPDLIRLWQHYVQPIVNERYQPWQPGCDSARVRADVGWNWRQISIMRGIHSFLSRAPGAPSSNAIGICLTLQQDGISFPIGMLTMVPKLQCQVADWGTRGFAWFLSDAPKEVYRNLLHIDPVHGVAKALLDCVVQATLAAGGNGEIVLHADPKGGEKLIEFYEGKCGMTRLERTNQPVVRFRGNTHRDEFFYWDAATALEFSQQFDDKRIRTAAHRSVLR